MCALRRPGKSKKGGPVKSSSKLGAQRHESLETDLPDDIVGVNKRHQGIGECLSVGDEGGELSFPHLVGEECYVYKETRMFIRQ